MGLSAVKRIPPGRAHQRGAGGSLLGVHPNTVRAWTESGRLAAWRINPRGDRRYRRADVEHLLAEGEPCPPDGLDGSPPR